MMNRNVFIFLILLFLLSTVLVCVFQPKTHKPLAFENRNFKLELIFEKIVPNNNNSTENDLIEIDIDVPEININLSSVNEKIREVPQKQTVSNNKNNKNDKKVSTKTEKTQIVAKNTASKSTKVNSSSTVKNPDIKTVLDKNEQVAMSDKQENVSKQTTKTDNISEKNQTKILTEEEEIIAWNKWRSDLQNKLMSESKIAAPIGTTFAFSFTVDKFGTISNLKTWSTNPSYTPLAVRVIKPLLLSYQRTAILNFPMGSRRVVTNVNGGFTMARSSRYSSPADYNDYERVTK